MKKHLIIIEEKTGKERKIAINSSIQKALKLYMGCYSPDTDDYLFASRKGKNKPITSVQAYRTLNDAALVMDMLNYSSPSITLRYIGITQEQKDSTYLMVEI